LFFLLFPPLFLLLFLFFSPPPPPHCQAILHIFLIFFVWGWSFLHKKREISSLLIKNNKKRIGKTYS